MKFIQEIFAGLTEDLKSVKRKHPPHYMMAKKFIADLNKKLAMTKQSKDPDKAIERYILFYTTKLKALDEQIALALQTKKNITNLKWRKELYKKALYDFKLLKNLRKK
jgi:hypothetical protein